MKKIMKCPGSKQGIVFNHRCRERSTLSPAVIAGAVIRDKVIPPLPSLSNPSFIVIARSEAIQAVAVIAKERSV
jgi:hypothetical protein